jgi:hypothetical protein
MSTRRRGSQDDQQGQQGPKASQSDDELMSVPEELAFTGWFPDMRKTFPFTTIWSHENFSGEIIGLLTTRDQSET